MGKYWGKFFQYKYIVFHPFCKLSQKFSAVRQIFYGGVLKTTFYVSTKTILKLFFENKTSLHHFWNLKEKNYAFSMKSIGGVVKTAFYLSTGTFRGVFLGKSTISSLLDVVGELFDLLRNCFGGVVKFCNCVSIETFRGKKVFFPAKWSFSKEAGVEGKIFGNCRKIFNRAAETAFRLPVGNFFKKNTVCEKESFSSQFRKSIENVSAFVDFFLWWCCQNHLLRVHGNILRDLFFPIRFLLFHFRTVSEKFPAFSEKKFDWIVKTAFQVSMVKYSGQFL